MGLINMPDWLGEQKIMQIYKKDFIPDHQIIFAETKTIRAKL